MRTSSLLVAVFVVILAGRAAATPPPEFRNGGTLLTSTGDPVPDGTYSVTFSIYDALTAGTALWTSGVRQVSVRDGLYSYTLGTAVPFPDRLFADNTSLWLGIQVGGDPEMVPRLQIISTPYSLVSKSVDGDIRTSAGKLTLEDQSGNPSDSQIVIRNEVSNLDHHGHVTILKISSNGQDSTGLIDLDGNSELPSIDVRGTSNPDSGIVVSSLVDDHRHHGHVTILKIHDNGQDSTNMIDLDGNPALPAIQLQDTDNPDSGIVVSSVIDHYKHHGHVTILKIHNSGTDTTGMIDLDGNPELPAIQLQDTDNPDSGIVVSSVIDHYKHHGHVTILKIHNNGQDSTNLIDLDGNPELPAIQLQDTDNPDSGIVVSSVIDHYKHHGHVTILKIHNNGQDSTNLIDLDGNPELPAIQVGDNSAPDSGVVVSNYVDGSGHHGHVTILKIANSGTDSSSIVDIDGDDTQAGITLYGGGGGSGGMIALLANSTPSSGKIGVNNPNPAYEVDVVGTICATNGMCQQSDRRLKKDIAPLTGGLAAIEKLNPVKYHWRQKEYPERHFTSKEQIGLIAQEVKEVLPQIVSQGSDGMYSLDYAHLTPVLISAVKKQQQEIKSLKDRLAKLEAQMNQLTQAMSSNGSPILGQK